MLSIGELAAEFGLAPHVLRHWEAEGVLEPAARVGGKRRYDESARMRIGTILRGRFRRGGAARSRAARAVEPRSARATSTPQ